ncbi:SET domain-containing protein 9 isoform X2 [Bombina bombina]|uniref:SET domain-containing protein 9 isoform X2 n=1 Tax=Bombina bombina TaxID=8345 RepID=UPI00235B1A5E|nr:SET domain-containing protein 9 isoform X2 [Bombina bombina]
MTGLPLSDMHAARSLFRAFVSKWRSYKYRFVPWIAFNLDRNRRTMRYVPEGSCDKTVADADISSALIKLFRNLFTSNLSKQWELLHMLHETTKSRYQAPVTSGHQHDRYKSKDMFNSSQTLHDSLGFCIECGQSTLSSAGIGVFVSKGFVSKGSVVAMYPGTVYQQYEPIFFQSIGNPFIFRCLDGILIDGNDKGISKSVYRSCSRRDQLGPLKMCDTTWLTLCLNNPLAVGQYVNNCSNEYAANVCYQEFDVPEYFPVEFRQYLPNISYSHDTEGPLRCVVLVALRDINCGEELFSNYFTLIR